MTKAYEDTSVAVTNSKDQIEKLLKAHGVVAVRFTSFPAYAELDFVRKADASLLPYRITIRPKLKWGARSEAKELDRAERQVWRVAYWWLKAKFEAVDFGLVEFEHDFLPYMLLQEGGRARGAAEVFFERLAGRLAPPDDPFSGLVPAPPQGQVTDGREVAGG